MPPSQVRIVYEGVRMMVHFRYHNVFSLGPPLYCGLPILLSQFLKLCLESDARQTAYQSVVSFKSVPAVLILE